MKILNVRGKEILVDNEDFKRVDTINWYFSSIGYVIRSTNGYSEPIHRFILKLRQRKIDGLEVDHINGDKLDNRKGNLRLCTRHQNLMNMGPRKTNKTGFKGVIHDKISGKWIAKIQFNKKHYKLRFFTKIEAAVAYNKMAKHFFGEFAYLNKI